jgi:hypothetical protein
MTDIMDLKNAEVRRVGVTFSKPFSSARLTSPSNRTNSAGSQVLSTVLVDKPVHCHPFVTAALEKIGSAQLLGSDRNHFCGKKIRPSGQLSSEP